MGNFLKDNLGAIIGFATGGLGTAALGSMIDKQRKQPKAKPQTVTSVPRAEEAEAVPGQAEAAASAEQNLEDSIAAMLKYNPQLADQQYNLTKQYLPQYAQLYRGEATKDRTSDLADVASMQPRVQEIQRAQLTPEEKNIRDTLFEQIGGELAQGMRMTPEQSRETNQALRSAEVSRGLLGGQGSANREAVNKAIEGMRLQTTRQQKAQALNNDEWSKKYDPFAAVLGRPSTATNTAVNQTSQGSNQLPVSSVLGNIYQAQSSLLTQSNANLERQKYNNMLNILMNNPALAQYGIVV